MVLSSSSSSCSTSTALSTPPDFDVTTSEGDMPTVTLNEDEISHSMAARLTIALLGQMLYMKGQVPFPVASLERMVDHDVPHSTSRVALRAAKRRIEFLESYDDLTSHLHTTFVALSTALAQNESTHPRYFTPASSSASTGNISPSNFARARRRPAKVHTLLILGSSPSTAKARLLLELDGLRVERFGEWEYSLPQGVREKSNDGLTESAHATLPTLPPCTPVTPPRTRPSESTDEYDTPSSSSSADCYYDPDDSVPSSPSCASEASSHTELSESQASLSQEASPLANAQRAEEASLRAGERMLSRALFAGGECLGFGDEISPTQIHILIRAPRRFAHPTWVPRQSLGRMLDRQVQCFLNSQSASASGKSRSRRGKGGFGVGLRTVGVRVKCQDERYNDVDTCGAKQSNDVHGSNEDGGNGDEEDEDEEDELIWWSWDGKLVGFSD